MKMRLDNWYLINLPISNFNLFHAIPTVKILNVLIDAMPFYPEMLIR